MPSLRVVLRVKRDVDCALLSSARLRPCRLMTTQLKFSLRPQPINRHTCCLSCSSANIGAQSKPCSQLNAVAKKYPKTLEKLRTMLGLTPSEEEHKRPKNNSDKIYGKLISIEALVSMNSLPLGLFLRGAQGRVP